MKNTDTIWGLIGKDSSLPKTQLKSTSYDPDALVIFAWTAIPTRNPNDEIERFEIDWVNEALEAYITYCNELSKKVQGDMRSMDKFIDTLLDDEANSMRKYLNDEEYNHLQRLYDRYSGFDHSISEESKLSTFLNFNILAKCRLSENKLHYEELDKAILDQFKIIQPFRKHIKYTDTPSMSFADDLSDGNSTLNQLHFVSGLRSSSPDGIRLKTTIFR